MSRIGNRFGPLVDDLRRAVFDSPGALDPQLRHAAGSGTDVPEPWREYVAKVRDQSYRITDSDIADLKNRGRTEEEIFEITVAAAQGAALLRLEAGLRALEGRAP